MVAPAFASIDDDGFGDDVQLSVAHIGQVRENTLACVNERLPGVSHSFTAFQQQVAVRLPRLHSVRWVGWRPWRIWIPGRAGAFGSPPTIDVILHCDCETWPVRIYAHNSTLPGDVPLSSVLDAETASGASGQGRNVSVATDQTITITVPVQPGEWNVLYLLYRSEHQTAALTTIAATLIRFGSNGAALFGSGLFSGLSADSIPERFVTPAASGEPVVSSDAYTIAYYDDNGSTESLAFLAEGFGIPSERVSAASWQHGTLGVLELRSVAVDLSQSIAIDSDGVGYWRGVRYLQPPRALQLSMTAQAADQMHDARLPQLCFTGDADDLTVPSYPGILASDGTIDDFTNDPYAIGSFTTIYRRSWMNRQGMRATDVAHLEAMISTAYVSGVTDCEFRFRLAVRDTSANIVASATVDRTFEKSTPYRFTAEWIRLTSLQRIVGFGTYTAPTLPESKWSHDGATAIQDINANYWTPVTIRLDVSGLSASTLYYVDIDVQRQTVFGATDAGCLAFGAVAIRELSGAGPR